MKNIKEWEMTEIVHELKSKQDLLKSVSEIKDRLGKNGYLTDEMEEYETSILEDIESIKQDRLINCIKNNELKSFTKNLKDFFIDYNELCKTILSPFERERIIKSRDLSKELFYLIIENIEKYDD